MSKYSTDPADYHAFMWQVQTELEHLHVYILEIDRIAAANRVRGGYADENGESGS